MSLLAMPWVVVNMGCEMVYIMDQRLRAQGVAEAKSTKVLQDVVTAMFNKAFINEKLFIPQQMYTLSSIRTIFDKLAHSSIMRLSESSMDKLFDLMVMAAKYQVFCSARNEDMMQVVLRHLVEVGSIMDDHLAPGSSDQMMVQGLLDNARAATTAMYAHLSAGQWTLLRHTLGRFFQDKRVKVSLFLSEGIQTPSGGLILPSCITPDLGTVNSYSSSGGAAGKTRLPLAVLQVDGNEFFCHPVPFGNNLYSKDRMRVAPPPRSHDEKGADGQPAAPAAADAQQKAQMELTGGGQVARQELELLSTVLQMGSRSGIADDNFKLNLFGDDEEVTAAAPVSLPEPRFATPAGHGQGAAVKEARFGITGMNAAYKTASGIAGVLKDLELEGEGEGTKKSRLQQQQQQDPDLLDLLDSTT